MTQRRNEVLHIAGYRPVPRKITLDLDPVRATRLAAIEAKHGVKAEAIILDLLDDHIFSEPPVT